MANGTQPPANAEKDSKVGLDIFISYSRRDCLEFADQLAVALEACGHTPELDRHGISGGEDWKKRLAACRTGG